MFLSYYQMECNPFDKKTSTSNAFISSDFNQAYSRMRYLVDIKGIGVFTGTPGIGKTFVARYLKENLNKDLYKFIYLSITDNLTLFEFYNVLGRAINIDIGNCFKSNIYANIQNRFIDMVKVEKIQPVIVVDEAHKLSNEIFKNFKIFYDFEMDSEYYTTLILIGNEDLKSNMNRGNLESLRQRIVNNYQFKGLSNQEISEYIKSQLEIAKTKDKLFSEDALVALHSNFRSSLRKLNALIINSLMLGFNQKADVIDSEIVYSAKKEMEL